MNGADRASQRTLIAVAWLKVLVIGALLGTLFGALTWNDAFPFAWLKSWWLAAPNPWGRALLALLPVAFLWASAPRRRGDDEPAASCFDTWLERVLPASFRGTLGLARPWHAPGLLHLYIFSLTTGLSVARLASTATTWGGHSWFGQGLASRGALCVAVVALFAALLCDLCMSCFESRVQLRKGAAPAATSAEELQTETATVSHATQDDRVAFEVWLNSDDPADDDRFGTRNYGEQLASFMQTARSKGPLPALRLIGGPGSGKTTASREFARAWSECTRQAFVRVECWAYANEEEVVEGILTQLQRRIGEWDGSLVTRRVAAEYARAVGIQQSGLDAVSGATSSLLLRNQNPTEVIARLDQVLERVGAWVVLWVDDLDRFAPQGDAKVASDANGSPGPAPSDHLRIVASLLHSLAQARRIGVICAVNSRSFRVTADQEKLFSDDREIHSLSWETWRPIAAEFRAGWLEDLKRTVLAVDLAPEGYRNVFDALWRGYQPRLPDDEGTMLAACVGQLNGFRSALESFYVTPRNLKAALRSVRNRFLPIADVADPDEILLLMLLKRFDLEMYDKLIAGYRTGIEKYGVATFFRNEGDNSEPNEREKRDISLFEGLRTNLRGKPYAEWFLGLDIESTPWKYLKSLSSEFSKPVVLDALDFPNIDSVRVLGEFTRGMQSFLRESSVYSCEDLKRVIVVDHPGSSDLNPKNFARYMREFRGRLSKEQIVAIVKMLIEITAEDRGYPPDSLARWVAWAAEVAPMLEGADERLRIDVVEACREAWICNSVRRSALLLSSLKLVVENSMRSAAFENATHQMVLHVLEQLASSTSNDSVVGSDDLLLLRREGLSLDKTLEQSAPSRGKFDIAFAELLHSLLLAPHAVNLGAVLRLVCNLVDRRLPLSYALVSDWDQHLGALLRGDMNHRAPYDDPKLAEARSIAELYFAGPAPAYAYPDGFDSAFETLRCDWENWKAKLGA